MVDKADEERWLPKILEDNFEKILRVLCFWENDDKRIGIFIRFLHHSIIYICFIWYIIIHTFMPSYLLFLLFYCIAGLIWLQHIIVGGCIFSKIESRLIGDKKSFVDPILYWEVRLECLCYHVSLWRELLMAYGPGFIINY